MGSDFACLPTLGASTTAWPRLALVAEIHHFAAYGKPHTTSTPHPEIEDRSGSHRDFCIPASMYPLCRMTQWGEATDGHDRAKRLPRWPILRLFIPEHAGSFCTVSRSAWHG
jgi:hypothetical protein